jgi:phospholipid/cholesterol/gamma-HCH transport system permease protein
MVSHSFSRAVMQHAGNAVIGWLAGVWQVVCFTTLMLSLLLARASYHTPARQAVARQIVLGTGPNLLGFTILSALISLVLIRIVVVTSLSYGLSQYALELVVRVLVLELIPLTAAIFVALRATLPDAAELVALHAQSHPRANAQRHAGPGGAAVRRDFLARTLAGMFSVMLLAAVSCVTSLVLAYLIMYGFTPWALSSYTRTVGQIFNPVIATVFAVKTLAFSLAVSLIPLASAYYGAASRLATRRARAATQLGGMVRLFAVVLMIEIASLVGNYY